MPKMNFRESGPYASSRQRVRDQDIVPVRLHAHDVGEKSIPLCYRGENCHATPRAFEQCLSFCLIIGSSNNKKRRPDLRFCRVPNVITRHGKQMEIC